MTADPKSVELSESERTELELDLQEYWHEADLTGPPQEKVIASVTRIVKAREAESELAAVRPNGNWQAENGTKYMGLYGRLHQRIQALADEWGVLPPVGSKGAARTIIRRECSRALLAALVEPCSCGSRDATSLTPGERLHHSPDGCTIERGGEDGR